MRVAGRQAQIRAPRRMATDIATTNSAVFVSLYVAGAVRPTSDCDQRRLEDAADHHAGCAAPTKRSQSDELRERSTGESRLGDEAAGRRLMQGGPEVARAPARGEHDRRRLVPVSELGRHVQPRPIRQEDVEQDRFGPELWTAARAAAASGASPTTAEARLLEQVPREPPEGRMVVDDQHGRAHVPDGLHSAPPLPPGHP